MPTVALNQLNWLLSTHWQLFHNYTSWILEWEDVKMMSPLKTRLYAPFRTSCFTTSPDNLQRNRDTCHHYSPPTTTTMRLSTLSCSLLACISPLVSATALTYKLAAHEKACFYAKVEEKGAKVAFYFAVCLSHDINQPTQYLMIREC